MNPIDVGASYDQIADRWNGSEFDRSNGLALHGRALEFLKQGAVALDIGCGCSGRFIDLLLDRDFFLFWLEIDRVFDIRDDLAALCFQTFDYFMNSVPVPGLIE